MMLKENARADINIIYAQLERRVFLLEETHAQTP